MEMVPMLEIERLGVVVFEGEFVVVTGKPGMEKSMFIRRLNPVGALRSRELLFWGRRGGFGRKLSSQVGVIFEYHVLNERATVIGSILRGVRRFRYSDEEKKLAYELLYRFGLGEQMFLKVGELSQGQRLRLELARTMMRKPWLILAPEPLASIDLESFQVIMGQLLQLTKEQNLTCILNVPEGVAAHGVRVIEFEESLSAGRTLIASH